MELFTVLQQVVMPRKCLAAAWIVARQGTGDEALAGRKLLVGADVVAVHVPLLRLCLGAVLVRLAADGLVVGLGVLAVDVC